MGKRTFVFFIILGLPVGASFLFAAPAEISIVPNRISLGPDLYLLNKSDSEKGPREVFSLSEERWTRSGVDVPALGYGRSPQWSRLALRNPGPAPLVRWLEIGVPWMDRAELYRAENLERPLAVSGDLLPFSTRSLDYRNVAFRLELAAGESVTYYLRTYNQGTMILPLTLWENERFERARTIEHTLLGVFYGAGLIMVLFNLFIFFAARDRTYLYYVFFLVALLAWAFHFNGFLLQFVLPDAPEFLNRTSLPLAFLMVIAGLGFSRSFLGTPRSMPLGDRFIFAFQLLLLPGIPIGFWNYRVGSILVSLTGILMPAVLLSVSFVLLRRGNRTARFFLVAWFSVILSAFGAPLRNLALLPSALVDHALQIGFFFQMFLFSLALADRINVMRRSATVAESELSEYHEASSRFVPEFVRYLHRDLREISLGQSVDLTLTVMFSDIRAFTRLSATMNSVELLKFLNAYYARLNPAVENFGGFIDKHIGDSVLAVFPENPDSALIAAVNAIYELNGYNEQRISSGYVPIKTCFGIHTGPVTIGTVGSVHRMETTVIGDTVNIASRVEQLNKDFFSSILLTQASYDLLHKPGAFDIRKVAVVRLRGKQSPLTLFECFENDPLKLKDEKHASGEPLLRGLDLFQAGDTRGALDLFERASRLCPADPVALYHIQRCRAVLEGSEANPTAGAAGILIVDDNPAILDLLNLRLRTRKLKADLCTGPADALAAIDRNEYHLVVVDVHLGDESGFDLIEKIRQKDNTRYARVLILSADDTPETATHAAQAGVEYFLKPQDFERLLTRMEALESQRAGQFTA